MYESRYFFPADRECCGIHYCTFQVQGRALFRVEPKSHGTGHALDLAQLLLHYPDGWGEQSNIISVSQRCDMLSQHVDRCLFRIFR
ncbi:hypothetical protein T4E_7757 [Trichinella pseudospiralis]|uniref:Uncharacterized protein n=1 Tax=Trichinella pseudospiralis TaxID=6337 RepID=A0A0V0XTF9_TRIPS|nr:hypothetical protein T4E_7757 [Trichinella pseudospiralis]